MTRIRRTASPVVRLYVALPALGLLAFALLAVTAWPASASWGSLGTGSGSAQAATVNRATAPTVTKSAPNASVSWAAVTLSNATAATGYRVLRHVGATTTTVCTTTAPTVSCTDTAPVMGTATYGVVAIHTLWNGAESLLTTFQYDSTAPVTTGSKTGTPNGAGWIIGTTSTVTLTATDSESGVASTTYQVNGGSVLTYSAPFAVSTQGTTTITYHSTDNAGNVESTKTLTVKLDNVVPVTTGSKTGTANGAGWIKAASSTVTLAATDATSGVASTTYQINGGSVLTYSAPFAVSSQGTTTITYHSTDVAGNVESTKTLTVKLDNVVPTAMTTFPNTGSASLLTFNGNCLNSASAAVNGVCGTSADATSGVLSIKYEVRRTIAIVGTTCWSGSAWVSCGAGLFVTALAGPTPVTSWRVPMNASDLGVGNTIDVRILVTDVAGNVSLVVNPTSSFNVLV